MIGMDSQLQNIIILKQKITFRILHMIKITIYFHNLKVFKQNMVIDIKNGYLVDMLEKEEKPEIKNFNCLTHQ